MIIGFKGENSKLKSLYKELGLSEVKPENISALADAVKNIDGTTVISNYNDLMVFDSLSADLVEKRAAVLKAASKTKKNIFIGLTKNDPSLDKLHLDVAICSKVSTKDMAVIQELYIFTNTDLAYSGKLDDDKFVVKLASEERGTARSIADIKKIIK